MEVNRLYELIRVRRKEKKLTQQELANLAGVSSTWITKIEDGHLPSLPVLIAIAEALGDNKKKYVDLFNEQISAKSQYYQMMRRLFYHPSSTIEELEAQLELAEEILNKIKNEIAKKKEQIKKNVTLSE